MENNKNLRNIVLNMLNDTLEKGEFSHIVINRVFADISLSLKERSFINRLYSGTLEKLVLLDFIIQEFSSLPIKKMKPVIKNVLRMSVYQMKFMDSVPIHSCIDEAVKLVRKRGLGNLTAFVNGILRKISREADALDIPPHIKYSLPKWLFNLVLEQYSAEDAEKFFKSLDNKENETIVRFNLLADSAENISESLERENCSVRKLTDISSAYAISGFDRLTKLSAFKNGRIIMQDISSMMAVEAAAENISDPGIIVDVCAAPGGKSLFIAEKFPNARVISRDITEYKIGLIKENIKRLGIKNIIPQVHNALDKDDSLICKADIVIADLPCSGLGVIRKKPDILYRVRESDLTELSGLQKNILDVVESYVKPGGILLFSTCTINKKENHENTRWFLEKYDFELEKEKQFLPGPDDSDGFYIARLRKK